MKTAFPQMRTLFVATMVTLAIGTAVTSCSKDSGEKAAVVVADGEIAVVLQSTPWLDKAIESEKEKFAAFVFTKGDGVFVSGSAARGNYDVFAYKLNGDKIGFVFWQDGKKASSSFKLERFENGPFGYRLTIKDSPRGPKVYYGMDQHHQHTVAGSAVMQQTVNRLRAQLASQP
jgi:hypothetical protein